jgi:hypothetical protein
VSGAFARAALTTLSPARQAGLASYRTPRGTPLRKNNARAKAAFFEQL